MAKEQASPPQEEKKAAKKKAKKLILAKSLSLPNLVKGNDDKEHFQRGSTLLPGTVITKEIREAYDRAKAKVGGQTPIEAFCE